MGAETRLEFTTTDDKELWIAYRSNFRGQYPDLTEFMDRGYTAGCKRDALVHRIIVHPQRELRYRSKRDTSNVTIYASALAQAASKASNKLLVTYAECEQDWPDGVPKVQVPPDRQISSVSYQGDEITGCIAPDSVQKLVKLMHGINPKDEIWIDGVGPVDGGVADFAMQLFGILDQQFWEDVSYRERLSGEATNVIRRELISIISRNDLMLKHSKIRLGVVYDPDKILELHLNSESHASMAVQMIDPKHTRIFPEIPNLDARYQTSLNRTGPATLTESVRMLNRGSSPPPRKRR